MAKFIKVNGINEKWERKVFIINTEEIKHIDINNVNKEAHIHLSDTIISTMELEAFEELFEKKEPTYLNEELGITTDTTIEDFVTVLPHRYMEKVKNCLKRNNVNTIGDLINAKQRGIKNMRGLGQGSFKVIMIATEKNGINIPR